MLNYTSNDQIFLTRLTEIIHANLANERFGVNDLASQAGMSLDMDLNLVSRISVEQFRTTTLSVPEIARKLEVNYIIEGGIQKSCNSFRLWIQLIDARDDTQIFSEVYNGKYSGDMFDFQARTARAATEKIKAAILKRDNGSTN